MRHCVPSCTFVDRFLQHAYCESCGPKRTHLSLQNKPNLASGAANHGTTPPASAQGCFDDVSKVFILQGIFVLVSGGVLILFLVVVVVGAVLVLLRSTGNWVSVHVVVKLVFHFLLNRRLAALGLNGCELSRVNDAGGCLASDLI